MVSRFLHRMLLIALMLFCVSADMSAQEDLCVDGTLLFREDFGGNDPSDPKVSQDPLQEMSYTHVIVDAQGSLTSGGYMVTKQGNCPGDTVNWRELNKRAQWHLQDDHTYSDDYTRGYFLEIDGKGDNAIFYTTTINDLCEGSTLTFSAYVANIMTIVQANYLRSKGYTNVEPRLLFELKKSNGDILKTYDTGYISEDADLNKGSDWFKSSRWNLIGTNFIVPHGVNAVTLTISNNTTSTIGNDFAIDDIEIHLCAPPVTIDGENELCAKEIAKLTADFTNDGTFTEPLEYKWWFSADSLIWSELTETSNTLILSSIQKTDSGWYKVAVASSDNIDKENCRAMSELFLLNVKDCESLTPPDPPTPPELECYPIIVNKYNWVLLVDNIAVRELFPNRTVLRYQWYKNGEPIPGANEDDYSEYDELRGSFQMILTLDGEEEVCSNILEINTIVQEEQPIRKSIYDSRGLPVREDQVLHGIYLYRYEQGDKVWTEKKLIP